MKASGARPPARNHLGLKVDICAGEYERYHASDDDAQEWQARHPEVEMMDFDEDQWERFEPY